MAGKPTIDFSELRGPVDGEALESLTRLLAERMGMIATYSGRGADSGKDLILTELQKGPIMSRRVRWLVSCKDHAKSGKSVSESEVGPVLDKVRQHRSHGFLLVTTTIPGAAAKEKLDKLDENQGGEIFTAVWDAAWLGEQLARPENHDLLKLYLPESYKRILALGSTALALEELCAALPDAAASNIREIAAPFITKRISLVGHAIWPFDTGSAKAIDRVVQALLREDISGAHEQIAPIEYDAFMSMLERLRQEIPEATQALLIEIIKSDGADDVKLNAYQFLSEHFEISPALKIELSSKLDEESLKIIYSNEVSAWLSQELQDDPVSYGWWSDLDALSSHTYVDDVWIEGLSFSPDAKDPRIRFKGELSVSVSLNYGNGDDESSTSGSYPGEFTGYFDEHGMYLEEVSVDVSSYYR